MKISNRQYLLIAVALTLTLAAGLGLTAQAGEPEAISDSKANIEVDPEFADAVVNHLLKRFFNKIDATERQRSEITNLVVSKRVANAAKRKALKTEMKDFMQSTAELDNSSQSDKTLREKAHTLRAMYEELMDDRLETFLKIRTMLTAEQKKTLNKFARMHHRRLSKLISTGAQT